MATVAVVIRFIDQLGDITDRVLFGDYSAERLAFGRVPRVGCCRDMRGVAFPKRLRRMPTCRYSANRSTGGRLGAPAS